MDFEIQKSGGQISTSGENQKTEALNEIRNEIADLAVLAASKVVGKTIDVADHQNMVDNFVKEVGEAK